MRMRNDQRLRACKALLRATHREELFTDTGPTNDFFELLEGTSPQDSAAEWLMIAITHSVWLERRDSQAPDVGLMLLLLEQAHMTAVGRLFQGLGAEDDRALEEWLTEAGFPAGGGGA
jgi:hypothetical protein